MPGESHKATIPQRDWQHSVSGSCDHRDVQTGLGPHLDLSRAFVATAGDMNDKGPLVGLHKDSGSLSAGGVIGGGAAAMRTLHTAARRLLHPLLTVVALLSRVGQA